MGFSDDPSIRPHCNIRTHCSSSATAAEEGVAAVSASILGSVQHHTANIGADVSKSTLQSLERTLLEEAKMLCYSKKWDEAISAFTHALAVCEKSRAANDIPVRAAIVHNLGYCLHCLGEWEAAKEYYEQALQLFQRVKTPAIDRWTTGWLYGDVNESRVRFIKERLLDITFRQFPEDEYLDEFGRKRPMPDAEDAGSGGSGGSGGRRGSRSASGSSSHGCDDASSSTAHMHHGDASGSFGSFGEVRPRWLAVSLRDDDSAMACSVSGATTVAEASAAETEREPSAADDAEEQEAARKEWLEYYLNIGNWQEAAELVVTREEMDDLEYLRSREERLNRRA